MVGENNKWHNYKYYFKNTIQQVIKVSTQKDNCDLTVHNNKTQGSKMYVETEPCKVPFVTNFTLSINHSLIKSVDFF